VGLGTQLAQGCLQMTRVKFESLPETYESFQLKLSLDKLDFVCFRVQE